MGECQGVHSTLTMRRRNKMDRDNDQNQKQSAHTHEDELSQDVRTGNQLMQVAKGLV